MSADNKALVQRFYDEVNAGNLDAIDELIADDFHDHDEFPGVPQTKQGVRQIMEIFRTAFPDLRMEVDDMREEGDTVVVRGRMSGTHRGEFMGLPPKGRRMEVPMADFVRLRDGKAVEHWGVVDSGLMMQQLGGESA